MTVLGVECPGTVVSEWMASGEQHLFDRDRTIYACSTVPFDWRMARDLAMWMISFFRPQMAYFGGLRSIDGFPLAETDVAARNTQRVSYSMIVTEMYEADPPAGIYGIPAGSSRHEKLTQRDILAMRQIQYLDVLLLTLGRRPGRGLDGDGRERRPVVQVDVVHGVLGIVIARCGRCRNSP